MAFRVEIAARAAQDIDDTTTYIAQDSPSAAATWKEKLQGLIESLQDMPGRFPVIAEADEFTHPYRAAHHFSHRVVFRIDEAAGIVYVVRVYHAARQPLTDPDIH
jgi:plasmid stabilization system protein ParE